jgi:hypothetical protein
LFVPSYRGGSELGGEEAEGADQVLVEALRGRLLELLHEEAEDGGQVGAEVGARLGDDAVEQRKRFALGRLTARWESSRFTQC